MCMKLSDINPNNFYLRYRYKKAFATSPFVPAIPFIFYRLVVGLYCLAWLLFSSYSSDAKWFIYVSNLIFVLIVVHFFLGMTLSIAYNLSDEAQRYKIMPSSKWGSEPLIEGFSGQEEAEDAEELTACSIELDDDQLSFPEKLLWVVFVIASIGALQITLIYWSVFYDHTGINGGNATFLILNSVFITIELLISNIPVILLHFFYSHAFQSLYVLFTVFYWFFGGTDENGHPYIYSGFDYGHHPTWSMVVLFLYIVICQFVAQLYCLALFNVRKWLIRKFDWCQY